MSELCNTSTIQGWTRAQWAVAADWFFTAWGRFPPATLDGSSDLMSDWSSKHTGSPEPKASSDAARRWAVKFFSVMVNEFKPAGPADNVRALPGCKAPSATPNAALVDTLRDLLSRAEDGSLQSFIGTGFMADGARLATWVDHHRNAYEMLGSIAWLHAEYIHRHTPTEGP